MGTVRIMSMAAIGGLAVWVGCAQAEEQTGQAGQSPATVVRLASDQAASPKATEPTAENNPTTRGGRGAPSLDDYFRPAAWIYVNGHAGKFVKEGVRMKLPWIIDQPVGPSPTFRVDAFGPLLGNPKDFVCTLESTGSNNSPSVAYAISAKTGKFSAGTVYSLLSPGDDFVIRNRNTGDVVKEIAPLPPGTYVIAAGIINAGTGKKGLAMTSFTVSKPAED